MKNTFGTSVALTLFGESHGPAVGALVDGLAPGMAVDESEIAKFLSRRRPSSALDTARREKDEFQILSGVFNGKTTGTPVCIVIPNSDARSSDYAYGPARPSHADYAANIKYHGFEDYRGGGHFSGRITAALVAAGGILIPALERAGITTVTHILKCSCEEDRPFRNVREDAALLARRDFPALDEESGERMCARISEAKERGDSVGGVTETAVCGLPGGLGEPWFDSVEGLVSHAVFSIGGIKGIEFGRGFGFASFCGSEANDAMRMDNGRVTTRTNNNGGVNGGITNGMPLLFRCAVKPTPSVATKQDTVDFIKRENTTIAVSGRHDPAIVRRICPVIDSVTALVICDMLACRFGTDVLTNGVPKCCTD